METKELLETTLRMISKSLEIPYCTVCGSIVMKGLECIECAYDKMESENE